MEIISSILKLSAGIGLFLFAMYLLEESLKNLSGRNFKIFLQRFTKNKIGAVSSAALVTALLQSSSMVSLFQFVSRNYAIQCKTFSFYKFLF